MCLRRTRHGVFENPRRLRRTADEVVTVADTVTIMTPTAAQVTRNGITRVSPGRISPWLWWTPSTAVH